MLMAEDDKKGYGPGYGKRPLWQWIVIYLIVGGILYALVYYFVIAPQRSSIPPVTGTVPTSALSGTPVPSEAISSPSASPAPTGSSPLGY